jgi:hypothetical protein
LKEGNWWDDEDNVDGLAVIGYVPTHTIAEIIRKHGGIHRDCIVQLPPGIAMHLVATKDRKAKTAKVTTTPALGPSPRTSEYQPRGMWKKKDHIVTLHRDKASSPKPH